MSGIITQLPRQVLNCVSKDTLTLKVLQDDTRTHIYRIIQNYFNTNGLYSRKICDINDLKDRIRTVVSLIPREMCVRALNGTVARWLFCVKHDGEQVDTVL
jgi:hypothetical protein